MSQKPRRVKQVEFAGAIASPGQAPPRDLPHVAIVGRSNVGKSSLINRLVGRKNLARTSKRPGRTQEINFFRVDDRFMLVDLPGYGFAKAPREVRERWDRLIDAYLGHTEELAGIILLLDARRGLTGDDEAMVEYLARLGLPTLFVLTKIDKLNRAGRQRAGEALRRALGVEEDQVLETSAKTGAGMGTLLASVDALFESA